MNIKLCEIQTIYSIKSSFEFFLNSFKYSWYSERDSSLGFSCFGFDFTKFPSFKVTPGEQTNFSATESVC